MPMVNVFVKNLPPYSVIFWAGNTAGNFDSTGLGIGDMAGWALCNGYNGTPFLSGQFPLCSTGPQSVGKYPSGGETSVTLSANNIPEMTWSGSHDHATSHLSASDAGHTHQWTRPTTEGSSGNQYVRNMMQQGSDVGLWTTAKDKDQDNVGTTTSGNASVTISGNVDKTTLNVTVGTIGPTPVLTMPPYTQLVCIMKLP